MGVITDRLAQQHRKSSSVESRKTYLLGVLGISHLVIYVRHHLQRAAQRGHGLPGGEHSTVIQSMALAHPPSPSPRVIPWLPQAFVQASPAVSISTLWCGHTGFKGLLQFPEPPLVR